MCPGGGRWWLGTGPCPLCREPRSNFWYLALVWPSSKCCCNLKSELARSLSLLNLVKILKWIKDTNSEKDTLIITKQCIASLIIRKTQIPQITVEATWRHQEGYSWALTGSSISRQQRHYCPSGHSASASGRSSWLQFPANTDTAGLEVTGSLPLTWERSELNSQLRPRLVQPQRCRYLRAEPAGRSALPSSDNDTELSFQKLLTEIKLMPVPWKSL